MEEYFEDYQLVIDLLEWLAQADNQAILSYARRVSPIFWNNQRQLRIDLCSELRRERNKIFSSNLVSNVTILLNEVQLLKFINALAQYNAQSVIARYKKLFPSLQIQEPRLSFSLAEWSRNYLKTWRNIFLLMSAFHYDQCQVYLKSLLKFEWKSQSAEAVLNQVTVLLDKVSMSFATHNFERHALDGDIKSEVKTFLHQLTFLPEDYITRITASQVNRELLILIQDLQITFSILMMSIRSGYNLTDEEAILALLWEELSLQDEAEEIRRTEILKADISSQLPPEAVSQHYLQLAKIITAESIKNGQAMGYLHTYIAKLSPEQKETFLKELSSFLSHSSEVQALFDPIDVDFFLQRLQVENLPGSKADFINSLQDRVLPESWPITQKAMLMLAAIF